MRTRPSSFTGVSSAGSAELAARAGKSGPGLPGFLGPAGRVAAGAEMGVVLGWMSGRVLGQYDLLFAEGDAPQDAVYYVGPIFSAFRGTPEGVEYYKALREEIEARVTRGEGPETPSGLLSEQKYRLVVEGTPNWTHFREFWKMFSDEGAVMVASTYTKVGGTYDFGFRHDPDDPLGTMADYCGGCYTNLNLPSRAAMLEAYIREYQADGFIIHSVKSCNSFSAGQLSILREVERRTGLPGGFIESDLVDPRYFSAANLKNRIESYLQMLDARRKGGRVDVPA